MNKFYNNIDQIASTLFKFFSSLNLKFSKPNLTNLVYSVIFMINSGSIINADLTKNLNFILPIKQYYTLKESIIVEL